MCREKTFRFAIMGAGNIAGKFCDAVSRVQFAKVAAVASKSMERARAFAEKNGVEKAYDDYEKMLVEETPDCVYIAATTNAHYALSLMCVRHGIPVLCEKAMFETVRQAQEVFSLAEEKGVFVMEAMWSRFLPAVKEAKAWVDCGLIGDPAYGEVNIGFCAPKDPQNRYYNPALGGGAAYDLMVYCYEIMSWLVDRPAEVLHAASFIGETGADLTDHALIRFAGTDGAPDMLASCAGTFLADMEDRLVIYGSEGKLILPAPHFASEAFRYDKEGNLAVHFSDDETTNGFTYEVEEAMECIRSGRRESGIVPHSVTLACTALLERLAGR